jgi:hypothetical protein
VMNDVDFARMASYDPGYEGYGYARAYYSGREIA